MSARVSSPILVGRAGELNRLREALESVAAGTPSTVLVGGEAGIGKTRLVEEFGAEAARTGAVVLVGGCVSLGDDEGLPFAPIAEALRALARRMDPATLRELVGTAGAELGRLVPAFGPDPDDASPPGGRPEWAQTRIFEELLGVLGRLGERSPVVLVIEDMHWADRSTRDVVAFVARNARTERLLVVGTYRTDELHRRHPLRPWLAQMERAPRMTRFELARLDRDEVAAQLEAILGARPREDLVAAVIRRSEGNPFYAEELVAAGGSAEGMPETLRDVLLARLSALSDTAQWALGVAAVGGRVVEHDLLAAVTDRPVDELEDGLREAVAHQLLLPTSADDADAYAFRHALLQEAVYDDLLPTDRRRLHAAYAEALAARPTPGGTPGALHVAALAGHASAAHDLPRALAGWIEAARASMRTFAFPEAARAFGRALDLWDAVADDQRPDGVDIVDLLHELALARIMSGEMTSALEAAQRAVALFDPSRDPARAARLRERLARAHWLRGDVTSSMAVLDEARTLLKGLPPSRAAGSVLAGYAGMLMLQAFHSAAIDAAREAIAVAREVGDLGIEAHALNSLGVCEALLGDCAAGVETMRRGFELTKELGNPHDLGRAYSNYASTLQVCGLIEEALAISLEGAAWSRSLGLWRTYGVYHEANAAQALVELGRWREARMLLEATEMGMVEGVVRLTWVTNAAPLAVRQGRLDEARAYLEDSRAALDRLADSQFTGPIFNGLAELALVEGRLDDAAAEIDEGIRRLSETEDAGMLSLLLVGAVTVAAERAERARARRDEAGVRAAVDEGERRLAELREAVARLGVGGRAQEPRGLLLTAEADATRLHGASDPAAWERAAAHWAEIGRPYPLAGTRYREAEALLAAGSRAEAAAALGEARAIAESLEAAPLLGWIDGLARRGRLDVAVGAEPVPVGAAEGGAAAGGAAGGGAAGVGAGSGGAGDPYGLTEREREVLSLLAEGYTNRRIAERLFISESTAGVHVSNILGKLGVANRVEAAAIAVRLGMDGSEGE